MRANVAMILEGAYAAWAARDLSGTLACFAEDVTYIIHLPPDLEPFAGEVHGRADLAKLLSDFLGAFDVLEYMPLQITPDGEIMHSRVQFHYRHKVTGLSYEGRVRHVWRVEGVCIERFEEFHDVERVRTFFKLVEQACREQGT